MEIILASKSPRRYELLKMIGFKQLKVVPASGEEEISNLPPDQTVAKIAMAKAREVRSKCRREDLIIAADTLVYLDGQALGKPKDEREAKNMLNQLSGRRHTVYTGVALIQADQEAAASEMTHVFFRHLSEDEIEAYIQTGEPMDKAGAYGAQGKGAMLIEKIEGDFFNVMGLPLCRLYKMLRNFEINPLG